MGAGMSGGVLVVWCVPRGLSWGLVVRLLLSSLTQSCCSLTHLPPPPPTPPPRRKYKDETARLNQALKSASMGNKATDKQADRLQKEIDKLR